MKLLYAWLWEYSPDWLNRWLLQHWKSGRVAMMEAGRARYGAHQTYRDAQHHPR